MTISRSAARTTIKSVTASIMVGSILAACSSSPSSSSAASKTTLSKTDTSSTTQTTISSSTTIASNSGSASSTTSTTTAGLQNIAVTTADKESLTQAYIAFRQFTASDVTGPDAGSVYEASDPATNTYWAMAVFTPSSSASYTAQVGMQDGGEQGLFKRLGSAAWTVSVGTEPGICGEVKFFPTAVMTLWGISTTTVPACA